MKPGSVDDTDDLDVCRQVAFRVARRDHGATAEVLAVVEELLMDEAEYGFVVTFLENLQNLVSHGLDTLRSTEEIRLLLGPRSAICWDTVTGFWAAVADWRVHTGVPLKPAAPLLGAQNEHLRMLLWTANRTLSTGEKLGIADAVRYEKAVGSSIPGYSHIAVAQRIAGQGRP
ncbi:hypothetical protein F7Q99_27245 [Streptomyces kaniharaensis]|uniref:Uncharacterized protein n=1 Tax=Streptomyces kaniharaensis TaxID=212423 RepID=A0A6N7KZ81_9ACTN|nr:hypothetical protein [Streptomyces kaniharaensis]MQS15859.1 hypothetical protein [Streptomyces kaniharaensis]